MPPSGAEPAQPKPKAWQIATVAGAALLLLAGIGGMLFALAADAWSTFTAFRTGRPPAVTYTAWVPYLLAVIVTAAAALYYVVERSRKPVSYEHIRRSIDAGRTYFLYLRPFAIEKRFLLDVPLLSGMPFLWALPAVRLLLGLEANLKRAVQKQAGALMIAIGETDKSPGVAKLTPTDEEWQALFARLAERACGIFIVPFTSKGTLWELDWLIAHALDKTVFVLPPVHTDPFVGLLKTHDYESQWQALQQRYAGTVAFPDYRPQGLMFSLAEFATLHGLRWAPDATFALGASDLDAAVEHMLVQGRLGGLVVL